MNNFFPRSRLIILGVAGVIMAGYVIASYAKLAFAGKKPRLTRFD
ncbi:hypothetical protein [Treponema endosymbiont of Eucomonympha sp.]|nr:hypothetical protein [Treponema endosymbiont of Eucomonympha sp.]